MILHQRKNFHITELEELWSIFYQIQHNVSHIQIIFPENSNTLKNIGGALKVLITIFGKRDLFVSN